MHFAERTARRLYDDSGTGGICGRVDRFDLALLPKVRVRRLHRVEVRAQKHAEKTVERPEQQRFGNHRLHPEIRATALQRPVGEGFEYPFGGCADHLHRDRQFRHHGPLCRAPVVVTEEIFLVHR